MCVCVCVCVCKNIYAQRYVSKNEMNPLCMSSMILPYDEANPKAPETTEHQNNDTSCACQDYSNTIW